MKTRHDRATIVSRLWLAALGVAVVATLMGSLQYAKAKRQAAEVTQVREFVAAFNARNLEAMLAAVDDSVQWLNVNEAKISIETEGKNALRESMERYFRSCPSCKSSLEWIEKAGSRVTAMERASWSGKSGQKSQKSLSVYEFRNGKILRVYYFPVDVDPPSKIGSK